MPKRVYQPKKKKRKPLPIDKKSLLKIRNLQPERNNKSPKRRIYAITFIL